MESREMRAAYCDKLIELATNDDRVCVVEADLMKSSGTMKFKQHFPSRAIDVGVAEANLVGVSAGLSVNGFIPFAATFGCFASRRAYDQFFLSANYARLNVKLVGTDPGVSAVYNGGTHMPFEDGPIMRMIPDLVIVEPSDPITVSAFTELAYRHQGCVYMRLHRKAMPCLYGADEKFELGKAKVLKDGKDVAIFALGALEVQEALKASKLLEVYGIDAAVIDTLTLKPIDEATLIDYAQKTKVIITAENQQVRGGLAAEVALVLMKNGVHAKIGCIGIHDEFGQVGPLDYLMAAYHLRAEDIVEKTLFVLGK